MTSSTAVEIDPDFSEELPTGTQLLSGQYTIESYLNHGGFGITYLATDSLSRQVVIKECFPGSLCRRSRLAVQARSRAHVQDLQGVVRLFLREAQSLSKLTHPNIVGVHQVFEDHGTAYMALDYVKGADLLSYIEGSEKRLSAAQIKTILEKVLDAVRFIHDGGLLHRDISPDNIILTEALEPILIDFGAAREQATKATQALSALRVVKDGYSPQEFYLAGSTQAPSSDLYSLAATFYHLITGETPPDSQVRITAHVAEQSDPYVPLGQRTTEFDPNFCAAIDRALAILPQDRVQTAADWKNLLKVEPEPLAPVEPEPVVAEEQQKVPSRRVQPKPAKPAAAKRTVKPKRALKPKRSNAPQMPALLMGGAAALVLIGGIFVAPQDDKASGDTVVAQTVVASPIVEAPATQVAPAAAEPAVVTPVSAEADPALPQAEIIPATLETAWADGLITLGWRADLPFDLSDDLVLPAAFEALPAGARLMAINDTSVATLSEAQEMLATNASNMPLSLTWSMPDGGDAMTSDLMADLVYQTTTQSGLQFETRRDDQGWITKVVKTPAGGDIQLQIGDEIVALVPDNERVVGGASLAAMIENALSDNRRELQFAVRRDDALWIADLSFAGLQG